MNDRLGGHLEPSVHGCAHAGQVRGARRAVNLRQLHLAPARHHRLRASYRRAGGRDEALRRQAGHCWLEPYPRHCP